jgi:hypothetical protein
MTFSQLLSGIIASICLVIAIMKFHSEVLFHYCIFTAVVLVLIWFPDAVNTYTLGLWIDGYKIENPTPPIMIAVFGWLVLLLVNSYLFGLI